MDFKYVQRYSIKVDTLFTTFTDDRNGTNGLNQKEEQHSLGQ